MVRLNAWRGLEPCTRLDHLGWLRYLASKPRFLVASIALKRSRRVRLDLGDPGSLNSNSTRARTSLVPKPLPSCDASASDWSYSAYSWIGFFFRIRPRFKSNVRLGMTDHWSGIAMYGGRTSALKRLASTVPVRQQRRGVFRPTTRRYEIDLAAHRASQGHVSHKEH